MSVKKVNKRKIKVTDSSGCLMQSLTLKKKTTKLLGFWIERDSITQQRALAWLIHLHKGTAKFV